MKNYTLTNVSLHFTYDGTKRMVCPEKIENCMKPGQYKLYPVEVQVDEQSHQITIQSLREHYEFDYTKIPVVHRPYEPKNPKLRGCDGNCDACRKCC